MIVSIMRHLISIILIANLLSVLPSTSGAFGQDNINDDGIGLSQSDQNTLSSFGDLIDFAAIWDTFEGAVNSLESTINTLSSTVGSWVNSVGNTLSDVASSVSSVLNFQNIVNGLQSTVGALEDAVNALDSLNPFGMILSEDDDADLSSFSEEGESINEDLSNDEEDDEGLSISSLNTNGLDVFLVNPQGNESEANGSLIILTNPNATLTEEASSYYSSTSEGNPWGDLWVNPTIIDPIFEGQVNGLTPGSFGLDQVDNTADLDKPISLALEQELLQKIQLADDAPSTSNSPCQIGEVYSSAEYFYVCVAANTWKRTNLDSGW